MEFVFVLFIFKLFSTIFASIYTNLQVLYFYHIWGNMPLLFDNTLIGMN